MPPGRLSAAAVEFGFEEVELARQERYPYPRAKYVANFGSTEF
jgi:hypothetical protein